jgi:RNA polymerase sigma-70 factor (ECF subfamily)
MGQKPHRFPGEHTQLTSRDTQLETDDTAAFMALLMHHRHRLYAFIAKQLVNPADVEDVFQKTSIVLWKKMSEFDPDGSFFHWACGIAFNEIRNFLTVQRRSRLQFDLELVGLLAQEAVEEESLSESRLDALRRCVTQLSGRQQAILRQCYAGTESITVVAEQLGRERTALYKQLARLREKLLACIILRLAQGGMSS